jgi:predicted small metal-binding protein
VFRDEPNVPPALLALDNIVLAPYMASGTHETRAAKTALTLRNLEHSSPPARWSRRSSEAPPRALYFKTPAAGPVSGGNMGRKYIDCREYPSENNCTVAMSADSEDELLEAAVQHAVAVHQHQDTPELRAQLKTLFKDGSPPA